MCLKNVYFLEKKCCKIAAALRPQTPALLHPPTHIAFIACLV